MVSIFNIHGKELLGVVLYIEPMEGCFRDSSGMDQIMKVEVLLNSVPPPWITARGMIAEVTDSILEVVSAIS